MPGLCETNSSERTDYAKYETLITKKILTGKYSSVESGKFFSHRNNQGAKFDNYQVLCNICSTAQKC